MKEDRVRLARWFGSHTRLGITITATLLLLAMLPACAAHSPVPPPNPIVVENQQPGTNNWQVGRPGFSISDDATGQIKGYASSTSVNKGGQIALHVSVNPAQAFTADVYRMGWYGGSGGRLMTHVGPINGTTQRTCSPNATIGIIDCDWSPSYTMSVPDTWTSGVYLVQLTNARNFQSYIIFVVRDDSRTAALLYQQSVTTYQAYNNYPNDGATGKSLYDFNSYGSTVTATGAKNAAKVSFDRPYADGYGSGQFGGNSWNWERFFIGWLEQSGYDVTYSTNLDTHTNGARLLSFKGFLSVGHDEYWSKEMMDAAIAARNAGVNLGFFGSDTAYWQIRFEQSSRGVANRVMVCYKSANRDPVKGPTTTTRFRDPAINRPEQALVGIQYTAHLQNDGRGAIYVVQNSSNWVWEGTGFSDGTAVPGILGYETDRQMTEYASPASISYTVLSRSPVVGAAGDGDDDASGQGDYSNTSVYQAPSGAWVFAAGANHWSFGLGKPGVTDTRIQRATANILNRFVNAAPPPDSAGRAPKPNAAPTASFTSNPSGPSVSFDGSASRETDATITTYAWNFGDGQTGNGATLSHTYAAAGTYTVTLSVTDNNGATGSTSQSITVSTNSSTVYANDTFSRAIAFGLGSADIGGTWTTSGSAANYFVGDGVGRLRVPTAGAQLAAYLNSVARADTDISATVAVDKPATGSGTYVSVIGRHAGTGDYRVKLGFEASGAVSAHLVRFAGGTETTLGSATVHDLIYIPGQQLRVRLQLTGTGTTTLSAKVWRSDTAEPTAWLLTRTDTTAGLQFPGAVGLIAYASSSAINPPVTVSIDDLVAAPPPPA